MPHLGGIVEYGAPKGKPTFPLWDRLLTHSIRPDGTDGLLLPYHVYLQPTGDPKERKSVFAASATVFLMV